MNRREFLAAGAAGTAMNSTAIAAGAVAEEAPKRQVLFLGDSILEFSNLTWAFARKTGIAAHNCGFGGCAMAQRSDPPSSYDYFSFALLAEALVSRDFSKQEEANEILSKPPTKDNNTRALTLLKSLDLKSIEGIVIGYNVNDYFSAVPIGTADDDTKTTFSGALNSGLRRIMTEHPHLHIMFHSMTWHARTGRGKPNEPDSDADISVNRIGISPKDYVDALRRACERNHVDFVDLYRYGGINKYNHRHLLMDGLHLTVPAGREHMGTKLAAAYRASFG